jgi:hypothetical protein
MLHKLILFILSITISSTAFPNTISMTVLNRHLIDQAYVEADDSSLMGDYINLRAPQNWHLEVVALQTKVIWSGNNENASIKCAVGATEAKGLIIYGKMYPFGTFEWAYQIQTVNVKRNKLEAESVLDTYILCIVRDGNTIYVKNNDVELELPLPTPTQPPIKSFEYETTILNIKAVDAINFASVAKESGIETPSRRYWMPNRLLYQVEFDFKCDPTIINYLGTTSLRHGHFGVKTKSGVLIRPIATQLQSGRLNLHRSRAIIKGLTNANDEIKQVKLNLIFNEAIPADAEIVLLPLELINTL